MTRLDLKKHIANRPWIEAEGGIVYAVDCYESKMPLTAEEAKSWPGLVRTIPWVLKDGYWWAPDEMPS